MKYWRGYLVGGIIAVLTVALSLLAEKFSTLVDMVYPYISRTVLTMLAQWTGVVDFTVWQVMVVLLILGVLATVVLMIVLKWNFVQWLGWVLAGASMIWCLHTGIYGLNYHASPLADDIRLEVTEYTQAELEDAIIYFRDHANDLAAQLPRDSKGDLIYSSFEELAEQASEGFVNLSLDGSASVFAGSMLPVKKLAWADMYTSMGICGVTMPITGEAAVNPQIPNMSMPFTMCHEMAHRMAIAQERDANLAGFLTCLANSDPQFQYSAYYMAYRYCYNALCSVGSAEAAAAAARIATGLGEEFKHDLKAYNDFFNANRSDTATKVANTANDAYIKVSGDEAGTASYGEVCDLLVSWYVQEIVMPGQVEEDNDFDPLDKDQVDISDIIGSGEEE